MRGRLVVIPARIREVRHRISEQHKHNPQRLINYYIDMQQEFTKQLLYDNYIRESEINPPLVSGTNFTKSLLQLKDTD